MVFAFATASETNENRIPNRLELVLLFGSLVTSFLYRFWIDFGSHLGGPGGSFGRKTKQPFRSNSHTHLHTPKSLLRSASATPSRTILEPFWSYLGAFFDEFLMFGGCCLIAVVLCCVALCCVALCCVLCCVVLCRVVLYRVVSTPAPSASLNGLVGSAKRKELTLYQSRSPPYFAYASPKLTSDLHRKPQSRGDAPAG